MTGFVDQYRDQGGVEPICVVIELPVATYYAAKKREGLRSDREIRDEELISVDSSGVGGAGKRGVWGEEGVETVVS